MGPILASLLKLQSIEHDLAHVRRRLRSKENALGAVRGKIDELTAARDQLQDKMLKQQGEAGKYELDLKSADQQITKLRAALNTAKTNKEYAAILTQINTYKADNSKLEDEILKVMQGVDAIRQQATELGEEIAENQQRLDQVNVTNAEEVAKLRAMLDDLQARREEAAKGVSPDTLAAFDRMAQSLDGEAMAPVEISDPKRGEYVCGGCYMSLTAEHYNALLSRDEIRTCGNCGRILYIPVESELKK